MMPPGPRRAWLGVFRCCARLLVSAHFCSELVDKILRYQHWKNVIAEQAGMGVWALWLVIFLLAVGCPLLVFGRFLGLSVVCLAIFQVPTSILFEDNWYESLDSTSALGGAIACMLLQYASRRHKFEAKVARTQDRSLYTSLDENGN